jgi:hypothetical protein
MRIVLATVAVAASLVGAASACPPPPPPPLPVPDESMEDWRARVTAEAEAQLIDQQRRWWNDAHSVLLARVERRDTVRFRNEWAGGYDRSPRVTLRPISWLKGEGSSRRFRLSYSGMTDCGPYGGGEAVGGQVGDVFVVFVGEGRPSQTSVFVSLAMGNVVDPGLRDRIAALPAAD